MKSNCQNRSNRQFPLLYTVLLFSYLFYGRLVFRVFWSGDRYGSWSNWSVGFCLPITLIRNQDACFNSGSPWLIIQATAGCKIKLMVYQCMPDCLPFIIIEQSVLWKIIFSADAYIFDENKACRVSITMPTRNLVSLIVLVVKLCFG